MSAEGKCIVCKRSSQLNCGNCRRVSYCSKNHQKQDWKNHKTNCSPYKIVSNEKLGRHLVSIRDIQEGEIIIKELPLVAGPSQVTPPVCLGCYKLLTELNSRDCSKCGWPVCCELCENSENHRPECEITTQFKKSKVKISTFAQDLPHPSYQCLTVLRCLYLKKSKPSLWEKLMRLESHCEERKATLKYNSDQIFIATFIPQFFKFLEFSSEEILKVSGIVQVNAHEIPLRDPGYIAIYEKGSFLEHNCKANCIKSFTNSGELVIRAASKISCGEHLSTCYTDPLWGRETRINHLLETKFFLCQCSRCTDPTELGTYFDSLLCTDGDCGGNLIPVKSLENKTPNQNENQPNSWKCETCGKMRSEKEEPPIDEIYYSFYNVNKKSINSCKEFLQKYGKILHPNHHILVSVKLALIDLFACTDQCVSLKNDDLEWMIKTCQEIYTLAKTLIPAENRLMGVVLYQLHIALMEDGRRKAADPDSQSSFVRENLEICKNTLAKAYNLLCYEPDDLPEGKMALEAKRALSDLEKYLRVLKI